MNIFRVVVVLLALFAVMCAVASVGRAEIPGIYVAATGYNIPPGPAYYPSYYGGVNYSGGYYGGGYGYNSLPVLPYGYSGYYGGGLLSLLISRRPESEEAQSKREDGKNLERSGRSSKDYMKAYKMCIETNVKVKMQNPTQPCMSILEMSHRPIS